MDLQKLNQICNNTFLPKKRMSELEKETVYMVTQIKSVNTRFGLRFVVTLNEEFQVFLPDRTAKFLEKNENVTEEMREKANKYALGFTYHGDNKFEFCNV